MKTVNLLRNFLKGVQNVYRIRFLIGTFRHTSRNNNSVVNDKASKNGHNNSIQDADS